MADHPKTPTPQHNVFAVYKESKSRLANGVGDKRDAVLVELWDKSIKLMNLRDDLQTKVKSLERKVRDHSFQEDILETKIAMLAGVMPEGLCENVQFSSVQH